MAIDVIFSSRSEAKKVGHVRYMTGKSCKYGHRDQRYTKTGNCVVCSRKEQLKPARAAANRESAKRWAANNPDAVRARGRSWRSANVDKMRAYRKKWARDNPEIAVSISRNAARRWRAEKPLARRAWENARRARKRNATPQWAEMDKIRAFYEACPDGFQVDHIIPLKHPLVCGLHVLANLQYLSAYENAQKKNRFEPYFEMARAPGR